MKFRVRMLGYLCAGLVISGIGCSLYVSCGLGSDAFNVMGQGISRVTGIRIGDAFSIIQAGMLFLVFLLRRRAIGIGTLCGTFVIGAVMNLWALLLTPVLAETGLALRLCALATAPAFIGLGVSLVKLSGLGMTPCDILILILHDLLRPLQFRTVRILCDGTMFAVGLVLGGTVGIGTVLSVLLTGPCIQAASTMLSGVVRVRPQAQAN